MKDENTTSKKIEHMLQTKIALGLGGLILKKLESVIPEKDLKLKGNWLKSFKKYRESIDQDITDLEKDKKSMSGLQYQQIKQTLKQELLDAENVFYFLQSNNYYITIPKKRK